MAPEEILGTSDAIGVAFRSTEGSTFVLLTGHSGGTWVLEVQSPDGDWVQTDPAAGCSFSVDGLQFFTTSPHLLYRLNGGTPGARAWLVGRGEIG